MTTNIFSDPNRSLWAKLIAGVHLVSIVLKVLATAFAALIGAAVWLWW